MPVYEFECQVCHHTFTLVQTFAEHDKHAKVTCPKCSSGDVQQLLSHVTVQTARKS